MGIFKGCILASDIDGTLVKSGYINPKNIEKIKLFVEEGGIFSISTGRSVGALSDVLEKVEGIGASVVANGCMIYDYSSNTVLYENLIPKSDYHIVEKAAKSGIDMGIEIHTGGVVFALKQNEDSIFHQKYERFEAPDIDFDKASGYNWNKVLYAFPSESEREKLVEYLKNEKTDSDFIKTSAPMLGRNGIFYEQVPKNVSKASALLKLCELLKIKKGGLFAIGDYYNDFEMLQMADISAAPNMAPEEIKAVADYITVSCEDGAVADFIDYLSEQLR